MTIWVVVRENQDDPSDLLKAFKDRKKAEEWAATRRPAWNVVVYPVELEEGPMPANCPRCNYQVPAGRRFCTNCGVSFA